MIDDIELRPENEKLKSDLEIIFETEGWKKLSEKQRQFIKVSLLVQSRADRPETQINTDSRERIAKWNCHYSTFVLENEGKESENKNQINKSFFVAEYEKTSTLAELESRIEKMSYPLVVHISKIENNDHLDDDEQRHTFVLLGKKEDQFICWEKQDFHLPYQVVDLETIYRRFPEPTNYWGLRALTVPTSDKN